MEDLLFRRFTPPPTPPHQPAIFDESSGTGAASTSLSWRTDDFTSLGWGSDDATKWLESILRIADNKYGDETLSNPKVGTTLGEVPVSGPFSVGSDKGELEKETAALSAFSLSTSTPEQITTSDETWPSPSPSLFSPLLTSWPSTLRLPSPEDAETTLMPVAVAAPLTAGASFAETPRPGPGHGLTTHDGTQTSEDKPDRTEGRHDGEREQLLFGSALDVNLHTGLDFSRNALDILGGVDFGGGGVVGVKEKDTTAEDLLLSTFSSSPYHSLSTSTERTHFTTQNPMMENNVDVVAMAVDRSEEFKMPTFNRGHQFQLSADFHKQPHEERGGEYGMLQHQHQPWVPAPNQRVVHGCRIGGLPKEVGRTDGGVISVAADASTQGFEPGSKGTVESIATHPAVMTFSGAYAHEHIEIPDNDEASILELLLPTATASTTASTPMVTTLPMPQEDCLLMPPPPPRQPQQPFGSQSQYDYQGPQPPRREQQQQPLNVAASTHFYPLPQSSTYQNADILMLQSVPHHSQRQPQMPSRPLQPQLHSPPQLNPTSGTQPQPYTGLSQSQLPQQPQQPQQPQPHLPGIQPKLEPRPYLQPHPHRHLVSLATATAATPSEMFQKQMMIRRAQDLFLQGPPPLPPSQRKLHLHQQRPQQPPNVRQPFQHQQYHLPTWQNWLQEGQRWLQRGHDHRRQWLQQGEDLQRDWDQQAKMLEGEWREAQRRSMPSSFRQSRSTHQRQNCGQLLPWPASLRQEWDRQGQAMRSAWVQKGYELRELWLEEGEAWMTSRGGVQNNQTQGKIPSLLQGTTSRPDQQCDQEDEDMSGARGGLGTGLRAGPFQILQQVGRRLLVEGREMGNEWMEELRRLERVHQAGGNGQGNGDIVMMD